MILHCIPNQHEIDYPVGHHIKDALDFVKQSVKLIVKKELFPKSNITIWCRGSSGSILASMLIIELYNNNYSDIIINHVKKEKEYSHDSGIINRYSTFNVIIDDFVASGTTIKEIMNLMKFSYFTPLCDCLLVSSTTIDKSFEEDEVTKKVELRYPTPKMLITSEWNLKGYKKLLKKL